MHSTNECFFSIFLSDCYKSIFEGKSLKTKHVAYCEFLFFPEELEIAAREFVVAAGESVVVLLAADDRMIYFLIFSILLRLVRRVSTAAAEFDKPRRHLKD